MRVAALDVGERRIGVAISDPRRLAAQPLRVLERGSLADDIRAIAELLGGRGVTKIVVGLPLNMDGSAGPAARRARRFAGALGRELSMEVVLWDERLTTAEAEQALLARGESRARRRELRDAVAAAVILQDYLDEQRQESQE